MSVQSCLVPTEAGLQGSIRKQALKRFSAVVRGGACKMADEFVAGMRDVELMHLLTRCVRGLSLSFSVLC
jgi:hypothetical protein